MRHLNHVRLWKTTLPSYHRFPFFFFKKKTTISNRKHPRQLTSPWWRFSQTIFLRFCDSVLYWWWATKIASWRTADATDWNWWVATWWLSSIKEQFFSQLIESVPVQAFICSNWWNQSWEKGSNFQYDSVGKLLGPDYSPRPVLRHCT